MYHVFRAHLDMIKTTHFCGGQRNRSQPTNSQSEVDSDWTQPDCYICTLFMSCKDGLTGDICIQGTNLNMEMMHIHKLCIFTFV